MPSSLFVKETHLFSRCDVQKTMLGIVAITNKIISLPFSEKLQTPKYSSGGGRAWLS